MRPSPDVEVADVRPKEDSFAQGSVQTITMRPTFSSYTPKPPPLRRWLDSFRRDPGPHVTPASPTDAAAPERGRTRVRHDMRYFDPHAANVRTANTQLSRELKARHLQMIAIGGSIGTHSLLVLQRLDNTANTASRHWIVCGLGQGTAHRRPGLPSDCLSLRGRHGVLHYTGAGRTGRHLSRRRLLLGLLDPVSRPGMGLRHGLEVSGPSRASNSNHADSPSYALQCLVVMPLEIIAASITVGYWNSNLDRSIFITIFLFTVVVINLLGVKGYGEAEFVFAIIKITAIVGFM